jgi:hypothetical protein
MSFPGRPSGGIIRVTKDVTFSGAAGAHVDDLFEITAPVFIERLFGVVTTTTAAGLTIAYFDLFDGAVSIPLSLNNGVMSSLPPGSLIHKAYTAVDTMEVADATAGVLFEAALTVDTFRSFVAIPISGNSSLLRFQHTSAGATSGAVRFAIEYRPLAPGGARPA